MDHIISVFVGRKGLGNNTYYHSSLPGHEVERCHEKGCEVIGLERWCDLCDGEFDISAAHAKALIKVPGMVAAEDSDESSLIEVNDIGSERHRAAWPYRMGDCGFADVYLAVARHGAASLGLDLRTREVAAHVIDAGGEYYSACQ